MIASYHVEASTTQEDKVKETIEAHELRAGDHVYAYSNQAELVVSVDGGPRDDHVTVKTATAAYLWHRNNAVRIAPRPPFKPLDRVLDTTSEQIAWVTQVVSNGYIVKYGLPSEGSTFLRFDEVAAVPAAEPERTQKLTSNERQELIRLVNKARSTARQVTRARVTGSPNDIRVIDLDDSNAYRELIEYIRSL
jgi:hypothetical protein